MTSNCDTDKRNDASNSNEPPQPSGGLLWRMSSGLYSTTTGLVGGAVGYGVGGVKWVAGKTVDVGSAVAYKTVDVGSAVAHKTVDAGSAVASRLPLPSISVPFVSKKDKKE